MSEGFGLLERDLSSGVAVTTQAPVVRKVEAHESQAWDEFVSSASNGHLLQSWAWGEFKRDYGWQPVRLASIRDGSIVAAAQVLIRSISGLSLGYVPRGPVVSADDAGEYTQLIAAIHRLGRSRHGIFMKLEPNEPLATAGAQVSETHRLLKDLGFVKSPHTVQARATLMLDLSGGADAVLSRMRSKTRYNVRLGERRGVQVYPAGTDEDVRRFHELMVQTGLRDGFPVRSLEYYRDVLSEFRRRGQAELLLAEFGGTIVGAIMVFAYGPEGLYMYGASSNEHRREMSSYLLQWRAIEWCIARGCSRYDLWGIPEQVADGVDDREALDEKNVRSGLWGVYRFKQGFGGEPVKYLGAYDYPYIRPLYLLWSHLRKSKEL